MLQDIAAGLSYHSAGLAELATYCFSPPPQQQQHHTSSSSSQRVDVGLVHGLLGAGGAAGGNGHFPPCSSGSCHATGVASGPEGRGGAAVMSEVRKARRLASNRESARRSRVRRRRQLDELSACASELRAANQRLIVELNHAEARYAQVARENARLREEARRLQEKMDADAEETDGAGSPDDGEATP